MNYFIILGVAAIVQITLLKEYQVGALYKATNMDDYHSLEFKRDANIIGGLPQIHINWIFIAICMSSNNKPLGCITALSLILHPTDAYKKHKYPTPDPTISPTSDPTIEPTTPTKYPTPDPTIYPTPDPTIYPTPDPTIYPTPDPTISPTSDRIIYPTPDPTYRPTISPTSDRTISRQVIYYRSNNPTLNPTNFPTTDPTIKPTIEPTTATNNPTSDPTIEPTTATKNPTTTPSTNPITSDECSIGTQCDRTEDCCPNDINERELQISCQCEDYDTKYPKWCCYLNGASGCKENSDCCLTLVCVDGVCHNKKSYNKIKGNQRRLLTEERKRKDRID